ncbi:plasmid mobilization protein [Pontibacter burrus]|uniref:plasmid mobilization protein n=1 Tax=Pontibacter burrus TaxID=2704466 RepID=UPI0037420915
MVAAGIPSYLVKKQADGNRTGQATKPGKKKGRAPPKPVKRSCTLVVRVTETERLLVTGKAREAGMSLSAWFRAAAGKTRRRDCTDSATGSTGA